MNFNPAYYYASTYGQPGGKTPDLVDAGVESTKLRSALEKDLGHANIDSNERQQANQLSFTGGQNDANRRQQGEQASLDRTFQGQQAGANRDQQSLLQREQNTFTGGQAEAERGLRERLQGSQFNWQTGENAAQRGFEGQQAGLQRDFQGGQNTAQRQNDLSIAQLPWDFKSQRFNQLFPLIQGALGGAGANGERVGGAAGGQPQITTGGVYTPQQVQQQVNASKAKIDQGTAAQQRAIAQSSAARGIGSNSPLLQALQANAGGLAQGQAADAERGIRFDAAGANAKQQLASEQAAEQAWQDYQNQDIQRRQVAYQGPSQLLAALSGLLG